MNPDSSFQQVAILQAKNDRLRTQVRNLEHAEEILNIILEGTVSTTGTDFFKALVSQLALALGAKYVLLGEISGDQQDRIKTLAYWKEGQLASNFDYELLGSPCATVIGNKIQHYPQKTYQLFPDDKPLVKKQIECYLGVPLLNSAGESIGIIVVMHDNILEKVGNAIPIISTFAARAAAELERKQSEATLYESEQRYRLLVEQSNDVFFLIFRGRFVLVNNSFCKLFEMTPEMIYAPDFSVLDLVHPSNKQKIQERVDKRYQSHMPSERFEFLAQTKNGRSLPVSVSLSYFDYKERTAIQGILHDLTQQKKEAARAQEQQEIAQALHEIGVVFSSSLELDVILDLLLEHVGQIVPYDTANVIIIDNGHTHLIRARGYEKFGIIIDAESQPASYDVTEAITWCTMIENQKPLVIPNTRQFDGWLKPTFSSFTRSWASAPIIVNGKVVAFLSTSKKTPDFYTAEHGDRLAAFAAQGSLAWQNAHSYAEATGRAEDLNLLYQVISTAASSHSQEDILQTSCVEIATYLNIPHVTLSLLAEPLSNGDKETVEATIGAQFINEGEPSLLGKQITYDTKSRLLSQLINTNAPIIISALADYPNSESFLQLTKVYHLVSALIIPITLRQKIIGIVSIGAKEERIFQDSEIRLLQTVAEELGRVLEITRLYEQMRQHAAELEVRVFERTQELAEANEQLKALDNMKSQFVSDVSHELRTPVTNLKLYLDLLERKGSESLPGYLPILQKQTDRLSQLIQDILDLSRLELGHALEFAPVDLNELVQDVVAAHIPSAEASNLHLIIEPASVLPPICGEWNQLAQVVTNLLANAINYSSKGKILVKTAVSPNNMVSLEVTDCGSGIAPDDLPYLFDRFYRGEQARQSNIPGTGLGLAIADEITRIHNGRLEVESIEGKGSTFLVYLPISQPDA